MLNVLSCILLVITVFLSAQWLVKAGKVPKMPAFFEKMTRCGIFSRMSFQNYHFRKMVDSGRTFPEVKIEGICSLYNAIPKEEE